ncbi:unnamed protein product [Moneuplotes crassus]|uniref:Uncharacterized protein n=1 Tax=Euplotes crassus TaxID=5936 RepID=A0AAD1U0G3_EUPCR|nr:unnamed protein product [Moneuplotes crassus]
MISNQRDQYGFVQVSESGYFCATETQMVFPGSVFENIDSNCLIEDTSCINQELDKSNKDLRKSKVNDRDRKVVQQASPTEASEQQEITLQNQVTESIFDAPKVIKQNTRTSQLVKNPDLDKVVLPSQVQKIPIPKCEKTLGTMKSASSADEELSCIRESSSGRKDVKLKTALRLVKRLFKNIFKFKNHELVEKRFVNCEMDEVCDSMRAMLAEIFDANDLTDDLLYYTIGIVNPKWKARLDCGPELKTQIGMFHRCCQTFSMQRIRKLLKCRNFRTLCAHLTQVLEDPRVDILRKILETNPMSDPLE